MPIVPVAVALLLAGPEPWPKLVEKGFGQEFRKAVLGETRYFEEVEFFLEPDEGDSINCTQTYDEETRKLTVTFTRRGRCSVKWIFNSGLTGYEVNYTVERNPKDFVVPEKLTVKVGQPAHVPCVSAIVAKRSATVKLLEDLEENGFVWLDGKKPGAETVHCVGRGNQRRDIAVTVTP
jgi:hypothetical protein